MKLFIDTADTEEIRRAASMGVLDGVTTNPSLIAKTGRPMREVLEEICALVDGPVSVEVFATTYDEVLAEARELASIAQLAGVVVCVVEPYRHARNGVAIDG